MVLMNETFALIYLLIVFGLVAGVGAWINRWVAKTTAGQIASGLLVMGSVAGAYGAWSLFGGI